MPEPIPRYKTLRPYSRDLRNNPSEAEKKLWQHLKQDQLGVRFYRQKVIRKYIVDFYSRQAGLVIEVDGGQHFEERNIKKDISRDKELKQMGLKVLRFDNHEVLANIEGVLKEIAGVLKFLQSPLSPHPLGKKKSMVACIYKLLESRGDA